MKMQAFSPDISCTIKKRKKNVKNAADIPGQQQRSKRDI